MKKIIGLMSLLAVTAVGVRAQSIGPATLNAAGGAATLGAIQLEWSIGEMTLVSTFSSSNIVVTQGVLQPSDAIVSVPRVQELAHNLRVFPNPATDVVNVQYAGADGNISCRLLDAAGRQISTQQFTVTAGQANGQVDVHSLAAADYLLVVTLMSPNGTPETTSFKIQKLK